MRVGHENRDQLKKNESYREFTRLAKNVLP